MKAQFLVTVEGDWLVNDKRITVSMAERALRDAVRDEFRYLAKRLKVERVPQPAAGDTTPEVS